MEAERSTAEGQRRKRPGRSEQQLYLKLKLQQLHHLAEHTKGQHNVESKDQENSHTYRTMEVEEASGASVMCV